MFIVCSFVGTTQGLSLGSACVLYTTKRIYDRTVGPMSSSTVRIGPMISSIGRFGKLSTLPPSFTGLTAASRPLAGIPLDIRRSRWPLADLPLFTQPGAQLFATRGHTARYLSQPLATRGLTARPSTWAQLYRHSRTYRSMQVAAIGYSRTYRSSLSLGAANNYSRTYRLMRVAAIGHSRVYRSSINSGRSSTATRGRTASCRSQPVATRGLTARHTAWSQL